METEEAVTVEPDWWFVAVDKTKDWSNEPCLIQQVESIRTVFLFDRRRHVHCCEITPSYECWPVSYAVHCKETATDMQREEIDGDFRVMLGDEEVTYYHSSHIEAHMRLASVPKETTPVCGEVFGIERQLMRFAYYGESGVPLSATNDDREKAVTEQRDAILEWYHQREIF